MPLSQSLSQWLRVTAGGSGVGLGPSPAKATLAAFSMVWGGGPAVADGSVEEADSSIWRRGWGESLEVWGRQYDFLLGHFERFSGEVLDSYGQLGVAPCLFDEVQHLFGIGDPISSMSIAASGRSRSRPAASFIANKK